MSTLHAFDFLDFKKPTTAHFVVTFGDSTFLQSQVCKMLVKQWVGNDEFTAVYLDSDSAEWCDVIDPLNTASLFGSGLQVVVLQQADDFVTKHRGQLEKFASKPTRSGRLVLQVSKWAANTKLYKTVDASGLQIECGVPQIKSGKGRREDTARLNRWICSWAKQQHELNIDPAIASLIMELAEKDFGRLDQELAKLSLFLEPNESPSPKLVENVVGGWRAKTIWQAVDAAVGGDTGQALSLLNRLLQSGEHPLALFGQMSWALRRYGRALELVNRQQREGHKPNWDQCLLEAGFQNWDLTKAKQQLKQLGRQRTGSLYRWLAEVDLALKGSHSDSSRSALVLEKLFAKMSCELAPR